MLVIISKYCCPSFWNIMSELDLRREQSEDKYSVNKNSLILQVLTIHVHFFS